MTGAWLIYALLVGGLLAATATILEVVCRMREVPVRWAWAGTLGMTVILVGLAPYRTTSVTSAAESRNALGSADRTAAAVSRPSALVESLRGIHHAIVTPVQNTIAIAGQNLPAWFVRLFAALWISLSAGLLLLFAAPGGNGGQPRRTAAAVRH